MIGIDEVGRGPWAGPLVACAVDLEEEISGLNDSKKLTAKKRQILKNQIEKCAIQIGVGWVSVGEVDSLGMTAAVSLAMQRALGKFDLAGKDIVIDGSYNFLPELEGVRTVIGGDGLLPAVSAASIVAKVDRDAYMTALDDKIPGYRFAAHKGYGTKLHQEALASIGISKEHRRSFKPIKKLL